MGAFFADNGFSQFQLRSRWKRVCVDCYMSGICGGCNVYVIVFVSITADAYYRFCTVYLLIGGFCCNTPYRFAC